MTPRRDYCNMAKVKLNDDIHAWSQDSGQWRIVKDHSVCAELVFETQRMRRQDLSGVKKYRVITEHRVTMTLRPSYGKEYTVSEPLLMRGGEVAAVRDLLTWFASGHLFNMARLDAQNQLHKIGATSLQLIEADDVYDWRYDDRSEFENDRMRLDKHVRLLEKLQCG